MAVSLAIMLELAKGIREASLLPERSTMEEDVKKFVKTSRLKFEVGEKAVRQLLISELIRTANNKKLATYLADRAPLLYRDASAVAEDLEDGYFLTTIRNTLLKLPTSPSFQQSHFAEILASTFAEEILGLRRVYSKLTLLTAENSNAYKIDLVMYKPGSDPVEFVFGEVKSSHKCAADGLPAGHDKSCFADLFNSTREYGEDDLAFDLVAAKDNLGTIEEPDRSSVRDALKPNGNRKVGYAGLVIIDHATKSDEEASILSTRKSKKDFDVDLICVEEINNVSSSMFSILERLKAACSP